MGKTIQVGLLIQEGGAVEEFLNAEVQYQSKLKNGAHLFTYYGVDQYKGADPKHAPLYFSTNFTDGDDNSVNEGQPTIFETTRYRQSYKDLPRHKFSISNYKETSSSSGRDTLKVE